MSGVNLKVLDLDVQEVRTPRPLGVTYKNRNFIVVFFYLVLTLKKGSWMHKMSRGKILTLWQCQFRLSINLVQRHKLPMTEPYRPHLMHTTHCKAVPFCLSSCSNRTLCRVWKCLCGSESHLLNLALGGFYLPPFLNPCRHQWKYVVTFTFFLGCVRWGFLWWKIL